MPSQRQRPRRRSGLRWFGPVALLGVVAVVAVLVIAFTGATTPTTGYDVSWPQCESRYPSAPLFGIVGVNGGLANNANRCLVSELRWARAAPGQKRPAQTHLSFYIDTGNPGGHHVADWPHRGRAAGYGTCNGQLTDACSYLYGEARATASYRLVAAHDAADANTAPWWLDVELMATWAHTYPLNIAALRGFRAGLIAAGVTGPIGIYSTAAQWQDITGLTLVTTARAFATSLPDWVAGTQATLSQARANCLSGGFTGAPPTLAQYRITNRDADLRCSASA